MGLRTSPTTRAVLNGDTMKHEERTNRSNRWYSTPDDSELRGNVNRRWLL